MTSSASCLCHSQCSASSPRLSRTAGCLAHEHGHPARHSRSGSRDRQAGWPRQVAHPMTGGLRLDGARTRLPGAEHRCPKHQRYGAGPLTRQELAPSMGQVRCPSTTPSSSRSSCSPAFSFLPPLPALTQPHHHHVRRVWPPLALFSDYKDIVPTEGDNHNRPIIRHGGSHSLK